MMKQLKNILFGLATLLLVSCQDTITLDTQESYIVFGDFDYYCYGGGCDDFYKITPKILLASNVNYFANSGFYPFDDYDALSQSKFDLVKDLGDFIPPALWLEAATHIGQAEVSDVGSLYFEIKNDTTHRYWVFENGDFEMPEVYSAFMNTIKEKLAILR